MPKLKWDDLPALPATPEQITEAQEASNDASKVHFGPAQMRAIIRTLLADRRTRIPNFMGGTGVALPENYATRCQDPQQ